MRGLRKQFAGVDVLDGVDLDVPAGSIFGFLGPNGAGKTTTIRALLGLVGADAGDMHMLGVRVPEGLVDLRGRIGAVVDHAALYPPLTGRRNLAVAADLLGCGVTERRIEEVLDLVQLQRDARRPVAGYSYGMRQRLALAMALLPEPALLVLDEPANGLDPAGQRDLRALFADLRSAGTTLFISSHLLAEVEVVCDHIAIIDRGRLVHSGPTSQITLDGRAWNVEVAYAEVDAAASRLRAAGIAVRSERPLVVEADDPASITHALGRQGIWLRGLAPARSRLEDTFIELTNPMGSAGPWEAPT